MGRRGQAAPARRPGADPRACRRGDEGRCEPECAGTDRAAGQVKSDDQPAQEICTEEVSMRSVVIERRFCGPPNSANGGYVCGLLAAHIDGNAEITLLAPPPLG